MPAQLHLAAPPNGSRRVETPIRVVLADDHAAVRRNLRLLLDADEALDVIAEATDITAVMRHVHTHHPQVLVLDLRIPHGSSLQAIRRLRAQSPSTEIVVLTMEESPAFAQQAIDTGAIGFVVKDRADDELVTAVRCAAAGDEYVSPRVEASLEALRKATNGDGLSVRETEVLRLIALGHTTVEIAGKLHLSPRTVETHRARIHRKLGLARRAELVSYALGRHLIGC